MTDKSRGAAPTNQRFALALGLVNTHKPLEVQNIGTPRWSNALESLTHSIELSRSTLAWVGGMFHRKRRASNACARTMTFLHLNGNAATGEVPPPIDEVRARLKNYGHGAFLWTTWLHRRATPDFVIALPWQNPGYFPHGPTIGNQALVAERHASAIELDTLRATVIAKELKLEGVLVASCGEITALIPPAAHEPGTTDWVAEWVAGGPIDACMAIIDAQATALRSTQPRQAQTPYDYIIDIYNEKFPLPKQLAVHGYVEVTPGRWLSPNQSSNSPAIVILQESEHWISFSGSDMAAGVGAKARSGVKLGRQLLPAKALRMQWPALQGAATRGSTLRPDTAAAPQPAALDNIASPATSRFRAGQLTWTKSASFANWPSTTPQQRQKQSPQFSTSTLPLYWQAQNALCWTRIPQPVKALHLQPMH